MDDNCGGGGGVCGVVVCVSIGRYTVYTVIPRYHYSYRLTSACVNGIIIVYGSINRPHAGGGVVNTCAILRYHFTVPVIKKFKVPYALVRLRYIPSRYCTLEVR